MTAFGGLRLLAGRFGDLIGTQRVFATGGGGDALLLGGPLSQRRNWHWKFLINVPIKLAHLGRSRSTRAVVAYDGRVDLVLPAGYADGTRTAAQFNYPTGVAVDGSGTVYVGDRDSNRIRKITAGGVVTTLAGSNAGYADGTSTAARFYSPQGVAVDGSGNVYVADQGTTAFARSSEPVEASTPGE